MFVSHISEIGMTCKEKVRVLNFCGFSLSLYLLMSLVQYGNIFMPHAIYLVPLNYFSSGQNSTFSCLYVYRIFKSDKSKANSPSMLTISLHEKAAINYPK